MDINEVRTSHKMFGQKSDKFQSFSGGWILPSSLLPHHEMVRVSSEVSGNLVELSLKEPLNDETKRYLGLKYHNSKSYSIKSCSELEGRHQPEQFPAK